MVADSNARVIAHTDVRSFFSESVEAAVVNQKIRAGEPTIAYVVNLLTDFIRADGLFDNVTEDGARRPLYSMLAEALESPDSTRRNEALKRLGDIALFISGFFPDSLNRSLVDIDYYVAMGGSAYGSLSDNVSSSARRDTGIGGVFQELSDKFQHFVDVLGEVSEQSVQDSNKDVLRLYQRWVRTGSRRLEARLQALGVQPVAFGDRGFRH